MFRLQGWWVGTHLTETRKMQVEKTTTGPFTEQALPQTALVYRGKRIPWMGIATTSTGTTAQVDYIQLNCQNFPVRKSSVSSNASGKANALLWEQGYPIWLPAGTAVDLGSGVERINILRYSLN